MLVPTFARMEDTHAILTIDPFQWDILSCSAMFLFGGRFACQEKPPEASLQRMKWNMLSIKPHIPHVWTSSSRLRRRLYCRKIANCLQFVAVPSNLHVEFQGHNHVAPHIIHIPKLAWCFLICWPQILCPKVRPWNGPSRGCVASRTWPWLTSRCTFGTASNWLYIYIIIYKYKLGKLRF